MATLLNTGRAPLLADHTRYIAGVIGVVESAWMDGDAAYALVRFAPTPKGSEAAQLVAGGFVRNCSMGFSYPSASEPDEQGIVVVKRWIPYELSLVAVPGNWSAGVVPLAEREIAKHAALAQESHASALRDALHRNRLSEALATADTIVDGLSRQLKLSPHKVAEALKASITDSFQARG